MVEVFDWDRQEYWAHVNQCSGLAQSICLQAKKPQSVTKQIRTDASDQDGSLQPERTRFRMSISACKDSCRKLSKAGSVGVNVTGAKRTIQ